MPLYHLYFQQFFHVVAQHGQQLNIAVIVGVVLMFFLTTYSVGTRDTKKAQPINKGIKKDEEVCKDFMEIEDLILKTEENKKCALCRW